ncbi:MAG TPA: PEP-CTERM sorting domain-containing protein [Verrucomicrobiae bacterium]|jgi:hypothetical protein
MKITKLNSFYPAFVAIGLLGSVLVSRGQGVLASGTISSTQLGPDSWQYTIVLTDTGSTDISGFWYAWTPDVSPYFYLPDENISNISGANGWTGYVDYNSIQFYDADDADDASALTPNESVSLTYDADFSPATLEATENSGLSVAYQDEIDGYYPGPDFAVTAAPEPSSLALLGTTILAMAVSGRRFKK